MIRVSENHDWVVYILLGSILAFTLMLIYLHRESSVKEFLLQEIAETGNIFPSWLLVSVIFVTLLSTLISQYVPAVPLPINNLSVLGISVNKFGYTFACLSIFYIVRFLLTYLFFLSVGQQKRWVSFVFLATRYYFVYAALLIPVCFVNYYFPINKRLFLTTIIISMLLTVVFKNFLYLFNKNQILPEEWYYKILYICTLQIAPLFALWRTLFF